MDAEDTALQSFERPAKSKEKMTHINICMHFIGSDHGAVMTFCFL